MGGKYYSVDDSRRLFGSETEIMRFVKDLLLRDYKIFEITQKQGELIPYHAHSHQEMILMLEGHMRLFIEEDIVDLQAGGLLTIEPFSVHLAAFPSDGGARFYLVYPKKIGSPG